MQNSQDRSFLGGIPYSEDIERATRNHDLFLRKGLPKRSRVNLGKPEIWGGQIVGYTSFTILSNTNPTQYEREFIGLEDQLNYFQFKCLVVHPDFRKKSIGSSLADYRLNIAKSLNKNVVCDVKSENEKIGNLLKKKGFQKLFNWYTPSDVEMIRFFHE